MLLARPHAPKVETINDADMYVSNFWRALQADPEAVARHADWPVNECDLHARHKWLLGQASFRERMRADPDYHDAKVAGWWVWGLCAWIGSGWCGERWWGGEGNLQVPHMGDAGMGVHRPSQGEQKRPWLGEGGRGVHRTDGHGPAKMPHVGNAGRGVHRPSPNPSIQVPILRRGGLGIGVNTDEIGSDLLGYFRALAERLRRVRVCCGDWTRILGPTPTFKHGTTAVFLDPPYGHGERQSDLYAVESDVAPAVLAWARENGDNPLLRIAYCSYGEEPCPPGWTRVHWKAVGGYGNQGNGRGRHNAHREAIDFSPACLTPAVSQMALPMEAV